ncbi:MAG: hypothetical protein KJ725_19020 [Gammaproteobacteria bacterium]|nr:hypothetical protein [Gammaproteobacteria bacterium]
MTTLKAKVTRHLQDRDSHHRRIAVGFFWVSFFVFVGKLAGAAKEMTIAWRYGISGTVDAYVFIYNLISWPVGVWFSVLTVVLVPLVARMRRDEGSDISRFCGELLGLTLLIGLLLGLLLYWGLPSLLQATWVGLADEVVAQALTMAGPLSFLLPMGLVISLFSAWMMACGHHRNTLMEALPALVILVAILLPPGTIPEPLVWGTVAGFALHLAGLAMPLKKMGELQAPSLIFTSPAWRGFWGSMGIMAIGHSLMSFTGIIDQFFAAQLGTGAIATLSYANRIMALVLGLGAMAISRATLPVFSDLVAGEASPTVRGIAIRWAGAMFVVGLMATIAVWLLAPWIVSLLFERGSFTTDDTYTVSNLLRFYILLLPFSFYGNVLVSFFAAQRHGINIFWGGIVAVLAKLIMNLLLVDIYQIYGLVYSAVFMYLSTSVFLTIRIYMSRNL